MSGEQDDFWGDAADWPELPETARAPRPTAGTRVTRWWNQLVGGGVEASRAHGAQPTVDALEPDEGAGVDDGGAIDVAEGPQVEDRWDDDWTIEPVAVPKPGVDPLLARIGGLAIVTTLIVPLALGLGSDGVSEIDVTAMAEVATSVITPAPPATATALPASTTPIVVAATTASAAGTALAASPDDVSTSASPTTVATTQPPVVSAADEATGQLTSGAVAEEPAERAQSCAVDYEVVAGDFWIRLADAAGVPLEQLLDANDATTDSPLYPGATICLPQGATMPAPPTTAAPATAAPATTSKPVATTAPTTAAPPTTATPAPVTSRVSAAESERIIREVWPDDLEDRALEIAQRESSLVNTAKNWCCYGLFQIHWNAHQSWLAGLGVTSPEQLFDATTNAYAAYALYQRSGGFGPWT